MKKKEKTFGDTEHTDYCVFDRKKHNEKYFYKKLYKNALKIERLSRLKPEEKQKIVLKLLKNKSERQLARELGIPHSTIHDWKTLRQNNTGDMIHISLSLIARKLKYYEPKTKLDLEILKSIHKITKEKIKKFK